MGIQFAPLSVENCHTPFAFVLSRAVTAIPRGALSLSVDPDPSTMAETKVPVLFPGRISSGIAVIPVRLKSIGSLGASLTGLTVTKKLSLSVGAFPPV